MVTIDTSPTEELTDDDSSISSAAYIPLHSTPVLQLQHISATMRVVDINCPGELVDTGGNFNMCNDLSMLVNVQRITPFGISMAASQDKSAPTCTHCGDFPIPMLGGSVFYTPMYYNPQASDCILSPHAICRSSRGYLTKWIQHGSLSPSEGGVEFYNKHGDVVIQLDLSQRNGLFYTTTTANATIIMLMFQMVTQRKVLEHMRKRYWTFLSIRLRPTSTSMHPAVTHAVNS
jgi:hypothetical protein